MRTARFYNFYVVNICSNIMALAENLFIFLLLFLLVRTVKIR
jgi:hypothetical protein